MKILANDGISQSGIDALQSNGFEVITTKVAQVQLENFINKHQIDGILVRSATQVRQELIDACPSIKLMNPELSLTPHIGAATVEAQDRIGSELATQIIALLKE